MMYLSRLEVVDCQDATHLLHCSTYRLGYTCDSSTTRSRVLVVHYEIEESYDLKVEGLIIGKYILLSPSVPCITLPLFSGNQILVKCASWTSAYDDEMRHRNLEGLVDEINGSIMKIQRKNDPNIVWLSDIWDI
jgi:hypothetical protein